MKGEMANAFLCPECGSEDITDVLQSCVSTVVSDEPSSGVLQWDTCGQCHTRIPAHISERWDGLTIDQAKREWQEVYRPKRKR